MPTPKRGESREDWLKRCIPIVLNEGTAEDRDQAVAICSSMWRKRPKLFDVVRRASKKWK